MKIFGSYEGQIRDDEVIQRLTTGTSNTSKAGGAGRDADVTGK